MLPSISCEKDWKAFATEPRLLAHFTRLALFLAFASAGSNMLARIPIMAITTSNSIRVNAFLFIVFFGWLFRFCDTLLSERDAAGWLAFFNASMGRIYAFLNYICFL